MVRSNVLEALKAVREARVHLTVLQGGGVIQIMAGRTKVQLCGCAARSRVPGDGDG